MKVTSKRQKANFTAGNDTYCYFSIIVKRPHES